MSARRRLIAATVLAAIVVAAIAVALSRRHPRAQPAFRMTPVRVEAGGYALAGELYRPGGRNDRSTAIVLLHGSSPHGAGLALYPALSERLAARGYTVLNLNQRGYNGSEGPKRIERLSDLDFVGDAREVVRRLPELLGHAPREIVLAGHSFGGGVAVIAGLASPEVGRVISISPGRRISELFTEDRPDRLAYVQRRRTEDLRLAEPIPIALVRPLLASHDVEQIRGTALVKPLLFVEGGLEPADDLAFTRDLAASLTGPVRRVVISQASHYFGTSVVETPAGDAWRVTQPETLDQLADTLDRWLRGADDGAPAGLTSDRRRMDRRRSR